MGRAPGLRHRQSPELQLGGPALPHPCHLTPRLSTLRLGAPTPGSETQSWSPVRIRGADLHPGACPRPSPRSPHRAFSWLLVGFGWGRSSLP